MKYGVSLMEKIMVFGGDKRLKYTADYLERLDFDICRCGTFGKSGNISDIEKCKYIVGPIPFSNDNIHLNAPFADEKISLSYLGSILSPGQIIIAGKVLDIFDCRTVDILKRDDFAILNAVPTAEGVLEIAMRETEKTIAGSHVLVTGFGKIGKVICRLFANMGAIVIAAARKSADLAMAEACGYETVKISELSSIKKVDIIVNTVPFPIFFEDIIGTLPQDILLIEAASTPGGYNKSAVKNRGLKYIDAPGLPGIVAPETAGEIIGRTTVKIINELGV